MIYAPTFTPARKRHNQTKGSGMNIREACDSIMGPALAKAIIADMGIHWCVIAAMSDPESDHQPAARIAIRAWNAETTKAAQ